MSQRWRHLGLAASWILLWLAAVSIWLEPRQQIEVEVELTGDQAAGTLQLFVDDGSGFREALSARASFPAGPSKISRTLRLDLDEPPAAVRIDPLERPGKIDIHRLRVTWGGQELELLEDLPEVLRLNGELRSVPALPGTGLHLLSTGGDPQMTVDVSSLGGSPSSSFPVPGLPAVLLWAAGGFLLALALDPHSHIGRLGSFAAPLCSVLALHIQALEAWWIRDDPCLLASVEAHGIGAHFWNPDVWRGLSGNVLMPWQLFSLGTDAWLFGLEPRFFYLHQILAFCMLLLAFDRLLSHCRLERFERTLATTLLALSPTAFAVTQQLMNRHYLEGAVLAVVALGLYLAAVERNHLGLAALGAATYLAATTAKEVFVPLVLVLPFVPRGDIRARWRNLGPYLATAALYVPWRWHMLGGANVLSGYAERGESSTPGSLARIPLWLGLGESWMLALLAFGMVSCGAYFWARSRWGLWGLATLVVVAAPLVPVISELAGRHFFLPALLGSAAFATMLAGTSREKKWLRAGLTLALLLFSLRALVHSKIWQEHPRTLEHYRAEGEFMWTSESPGMLLTTLPDSGYARCLARLRESRRGLGPGFCGDPCWCPSEFPAETLWTFEAGRIERLAGRETGGCAVDAPLSVSLRYHPDQHRMSWDFGPWAAADGTFEVLLVSSAQRPEVSVPVPIVRRGSSPYALDGPSHWLIKFRSKEGWQTFSPILTLDPSLDPEVFFERKEPEAWLLESAEDPQKFGVVP